jgi:hypothetical protein
MVSTINLVSSHYSTANSRSQNVAFRGNTIAKCIGDVFAASTVGIVAYSTAINTGASHFSALITSLVAGVVSGALAIIKGSLFR